MPVELTDEHLRRMRRSATTGLLELIKNSLDAGAETVSVTFSVGALGNIDAVTVTDDGVGMSIDHIRDYFGPLSLSWKRDAPRRNAATPGRPPVKRELFGRRGEGRLTAFGIGSTATWITAWHEGAELQRHRIRWSDEDFDGFWVETLATESPAAPGRGSGTTVTITDTRPTVERLRSAKTRQLLETKLGIYLEKHPSVTVEVDGRPLTSRNVQNERTSIQVPVPKEMTASDTFARSSSTAVLEVIEWAIPTSPAIWLAGPDGSPLHQLPIREAHPGVSFTAWLRWDGWSDLGADITLASFGPGFEFEASALLADAREQLSAHLRARSAARTVELVESWKDEGSYPFVGRPANRTEQAERELFDIVAVTAAPALEQSDTTGRTFSLRLLAEAVRTDHTTLGRILNEVLALDEETQTKLARLLDRAPLSAIVELSHTVLERARFLEWLATLLFEREWAAVVGETPGLHDLLAPNTWLFGDEWTLMAHEVGLTTAARQHEAMLTTNLDDPDAYDTADEHAAGAAQDAEVRDATGARRRLDLLLIRQGGRRDEPHYLVVELKRPSRRLTKRDLEQIENYLDTLGTHRRFANPKIKWTFLLVGKDCHDPVDRKRRQVGWPVGLVSQSEFACGSKYQLWVRTWSEVLSESNQRLDFVRSALDAAPATADEFAELHRIHADVLPTLDA